jgi:hypothetical protein
MSNATVRANARAMPEATNRRAVLGSMLVAGAAVATALPGVVIAAAQSPALSAIDRRVLDLWNRRSIMRTALERISDEARAAEAQMPAWARSGPKYVLAKSEIFVPGVDGAGSDVGWPEVVDVHQQPVDRLGRILARPNVEDLYNQFHADVRVNRDEARLKLTRALIAHDERLKQQRAEEDRVGYSRLTARAEGVWPKVFDIEKAIRKHAEASVLAVAASLVIGIHADDEEENVLAAYRAALRALRPQLVGAIAADADRVLAEKYEEAA